jgi:hypothetical protein
MTESPKPAPEERFPDYPTAYSIPPPAPPEPSARVPRWFLLLVIVLMAAGLVAAIVGLLAGR